MNNKKEKIVLIGAGGYCSGVIDSIETSTNFEIFGITDPNVTGSFCGYPILGDDSVLDDVFKKGIKKAHITVGSVASPLLRKKLVKMAETIGFELVSIIDRTALLSSRVKIGKMVYIAKKAVINSFAEIGDYCIINTGCVIEHGCKISNWVHIAPGATLAADITIGDSSHLGLNASVLQGIRIGNNVIVGAGSVVIRDVDDNKTVYGVVKG